MPALATLVSACDADGKPENFLQLQDIMNSVVRSSALSCFPKISMLHCVRHALVTLSNFDAYF